MVSQQGDVHHFSGTTKDDNFAEALERALEDDDRTESAFVADAVREYIDFDD